MAFGILLVQVSTTSACSQTTHKLFNCGTAISGSGGSTDHRLAADNSNNFSDLPSNISIDYLDVRSALEFSRIYSTSMGHPLSALGPYWRHTYDVVLARDGSNRHIFNNDGRRIVFYPESPGLPTDRSLLSPGKTVNPNSFTVARFASANKTDGRLYETESGHVWITPDDWQFRFHGPYLVSMKHASGELLSLHYHNQRISSVSDASGRLIKFHYDGAQLSNLSLPDGRSLVFSYDSNGLLHSFQSANGRLVQYGERLLNRSIDAAFTADECRPDIGDTDSSEPNTVESDDDIAHTTSQQNPDPSIAIAAPDLTSEQAESETCDIEQNPPQENFFSELQIPDALRIDARAASCNSYFVEFYGNERGSAIEAGFEQHERYAQAQATVRSFPIVDFLLNGEALVVKSRDLTSASYNNPDDPDALYQRLLRDGSEINQLLLVPLMEQESITVTEQGESTSLTQADVQVVVLELVIQAGMASTGQIAQIQQAAQELAARWNITLRIIEIP